MLERVDVRDGATARRRGHAVPEQLAAATQDTRRPRAADELVRAQERPRPCTRGGSSRHGGAAHLDVHVRPGRREVPERERAVAVQQHGDGTRVREDAGDVRRRGERPDADRPVGRLLERALEPREVDVAVGVLVDRDDIGDRFAPRAARCEWCSNGPMNTSGRSSSGMCERSEYRSSRSLGIRRFRISTSLLIAAVIPEPQKMTAWSAAPPTASRMMRARLFAEAASSGGQCLTTRCACSRRAAAPRRAGSPR